MDSRNFTALVLCLCLAACSTPMVYSNSADLQAQYHMRRAAELEDSQEYQQAVKEYALVAERYPSSRYYQTAVLKAALLNINPSDPEADNTAALHWLQVYLTLPLSPVEKESAQLHITVLERINRLETEISRQDADKKKLLARIQKQSRKIAADTQQKKELKAELAQVRAQLEEMKEVDLRMHTRRVNGGGGNPAELANKSQALRPEAYSPDTSDTNYPKPEKIEDSETTQKKTVFHMDDHASAPHLAQKDPDLKNQGQYPYTVQVSSFPKKEYSIREATRSRDKGNPGFTSHVHIPGKGVWYRVFIGFFRTHDEAQKAALELKNREYPSAFAVKMPFAIQVEVPSSDQARIKTEADLQSKGYLAYRVPDREPNDETALLIGAFKTKEETLKYAKGLKEAGFKPSVVQR